MPATKPVQKTTLHTLRQYLLLALLYVGAIFILPPNSLALKTYNLSSFEYHCALVIIALPSLAIWLTAFIGYSKLQEYARLIKNTPEGPHFFELARGCGWLAWGLPLTTIAPFVLNATANHWHNFHPTAIIISNYLTLVVPLVAFSIIASASRGLMNTNPKAKFNQTSARLITLGFLTAGVLYCYLIFRQLDLRSIGSTSNPYFLPAWLMIMTITVPYLYAWFTGLLATYELGIFRKQAKGVLYRQALRFLIGGLVAVILSSIALQYLNSVVPRVGYLVIDYRLVLTSCFRIIGGAGFVLLTIGALRLKRIEEV